MRKISVIIPVYNVEPYLNVCINSVVNQTYSNLEIIAIDDGSTDKSGDILDEWEKKDSRIKVIHKKNGGLSSARNAGLDVATGDYIAMIDSDDFWDLDAVEFMISAANDNEADLVIARGRKVEEDGRVLISSQQSFKHYEGLISQEEFWKRRVQDMFYVVAWSKLYKKELFEGIRFPEGEINEDVAVLWKIVERCKKIYASGKKQYYWRNTPGSITRSEFGYRNLFLTHALLEEIGYVKKADISEKAKYLVMENAFLQTTRILASAYKLLKDSKEIEEADRIYKEYIPIAKEIKEKADLSDKNSFLIKLRMSLFLWSKFGYFAFYKIKRSKK